MASFRLHDRMFQQIMSDIINFSVPFDCHLKCYDENNDEIDMFNGKSLYAFIHISPENNESSYEYNEMVYIEFPADYPLSQPLIKLTGNLKSECIENNRLYLDWSPATYHVDKLLGVIYCYILDALKLLPKKNINEHRDNIEI